MVVRRRAVEWWTVEQRLPFKRKGPRRWEKFAARVVRDLAAIGLVVAMIASMVTMQDTYNAGPSLWNTFLLIFATVSTFVSIVGVLTAVSFALQWIWQWAHWAITTPPIDPGLDEPPSGE